MTLPWPKIGAQGGIKISAQTARRIALSTQGFGSPRPPGVITRGRVLKTIERTGLLQIDSVNVLTRMHYLPLFSRLGDYPRPLLEEAAWGKPQNRRLFEFWAHEASLLPLDAHPLLRWRMARAEHGDGVWNRLKPYAGPRRKEAEALLKRIEMEGPLTAGDLDAERGSGGWWGWSDAKTALEWLFWCGRITTKTRKQTFERVYDLTERVLPETILGLPTPSEADAQRRLLGIASRALGVATAKDLRDYFRLSPEAAMRHLPELVEQGDLISVEVEGWRQPAFLARDTVSPGRTRINALLAPFDPLIWERSRTERIFGMRYRIEIYTPEPKREYGYYVLPFLMDDALVARVDLKSDRIRGVLQVKAAHGEQNTPPETASRLAAELNHLAIWLGLDSVVVEPKGDLAERLAAVMIDTPA